MNAENPERAFLLAHKIIDKMKEMSIDPSPNNYAVWYHYVEEANGKLKAAIDEAIADNAKFDNELTDYFYNKYVSENGIRESEMQKQSKKLFDQLLDSIQSLSGESSQYQNMLGEQLVLLEETEATQPEDILLKLIDISKALHQESAAINTKLEDALSETKTLKESLAETTHLVQRDFLTGIFNRKALMEMAEELCEYASESDKPLCLLMIDIDNFKKFNDEYGHLIGDEVLKMVAKQLVDTLKGKDIVARYGGEEFTVLLPNTPMEGAMVVAEELRKVVAKRSFKRSDTGEEIDPVTLSIGATCFKPVSDSLHSFIKRADEALYVAKHNGRNRAISKL